MDRTSILPIKDWIIKNISVEKKIPEKLIQTIITHQVETANKQLRKVHSVEFSGFGKFIFNERKAVHKLNKMEDIKRRLENMLLDETLILKKRRSAEYKLKVITKDIEELKMVMNNEN